MQIDAATIATAAEKDTSTIALLAAINKTQLTDTTR